MVGQKNVIDVIPKSYDEPSDTTMTHTTISDVVSGGNKGKFQPLPRSAIGEWLELSFTLNPVGETEETEGRLIWEGLEYEYAGLVNA